MMAIDDILDGFVLRVIYRGKDRHEFFVMGV